jgi:hypothetical protein
MSTRQTPPRLGDRSPVCVVVDPFSAGRDYASVLRSFGASHLIAVISHANVDARLWASFRPEDFSEVLHWMLPMHQQRVVDLVPPVAVLVGCETGVAVGEEIASRFGLPGNDPATTKWRRNKWSMGSRLRSAGYRSIPQFLCRSPVKALRQAIELGFKRLVCKPVDSGASDKVRVVSVSEAQSLEMAPGNKLYDAFWEILSSLNITGTSNADVLVQEFVSGDEYVVDHMSVDGRHHVTAVFKYSKAEVKGSIVYDTMEIVDPLSPACKPIVEYVQCAITALGVSEGPSHAEVLVDGRGPVLVEVGARPHGGLGGPFLTRECRGANQLDYAVRRQIDRSFDMSKESVSAGRYRYGLEFFMACKGDGLRAGVFPRAEFEGLSTCAAPVVAKIRSGELIPRTKDLMTSVASLLLASNDYDAVQRDLIVARTKLAEFLSSCESIDQSIE